MKSDLFEIEYAASFTDVTPDRPVALAGFDARRGSFTHVNDPLEANALLLKKGESKCLVVSIDALYAGQRLNNHLASELKGLLPGEKILVFASHTHFAPSLDESKPLLGETDARYFQLVSSRISDMTKALLRGPLHQGSLFFGLQTADQSINRRLFRRFALQGRKIRRDIVVIGPNSDGEKDETIRTISLRRNSGETDCRSPCATTRSVSAAGGRASIIWPICRDFTHITCRTCSAGRSAGEPRLHRVEMVIPMKICIVSSGGSLHTRRWAQSLSRRGHEVIMISPIRNIDPLDGVKIIKLGRSAFVPGRLVSFYRHLLNAFEIRSHIGDLQPDIVHYHSFDYIHPVLIALIACLGKGREKVIVSTWGTDVLADGVHLSVWDRLAKRFMLSRADAVSASSRMLAQHTSLLMNDSRPVHVIPFGVDCGVFTLPEHPKAPAGSIRISFIKHYKSKYGADFLIRAMPSVVSAHPKTELLLVGSGDQENALKELARSLKMEEHVRFRGPVSHSEVPSILSQTDIFAMPSLSEALGVAALEAQAMGVPVVATRVGGIPEAVVDGETGILVEPGNEVQLAAAIIRLIEDPDLRTSMGLAGRRHILDHFNWETNVGQMEALYHRVRSMK